MARWVALAAGVAVVVLALAAAPAAWAHAVLRSSDPAAGARLERPPPAVALNFTEAPEPSLSTVEVLDEARRDRARGAPRAAPGRPKTLVAPLPDLPRGTYTVSWKVVSRVDGHATTGVFTFGVGEQPRPPPAGEGPSQGGVARPSALEVFGRWVLLAGLVVLMGTASVALAIAPADSGGSPRSALRA